jgi:hypothetical protein
VRINRQHGGSIPRTAPSERGFTVLEITILTAIIGLLAAIAVPNYLKARERAMRDLCIYNLGQIDSAKGAWALEYGGNTLSEPDPIDLAQFFSGRNMPACPAGGEYEIGVLYEPPFCTFEHLGHIYLPDDDRAITSPGSGVGPPPWTAPPGGPPHWAGPSDQN